MHKQLAVARDLQRSAGLCEEVPEKDLVRGEHRTADRSLEPVDRPAASSSGAPVSARSPGGVVGGSRSATAENESAETRTMRVPTRPRAIAGNSSSGPIAAWGVNTPIRITCVPFCWCRSARRGEAADHLCVHDQVPKALIAAPRE
jgi:hypothetical protein